MALLPPYSHLGLQLDNLGVGGNTFKEAPSVPFQPLALSLLGEISHSEKHTSCFVLEKSFVFRVTPE